MFTLLFEPLWTQMTHAQIRGRFKHDPRAPLLSDCLAAIGSLPVDIEIKAYRRVKNILAELSRTPPPKGSFISSFDFHLLQRLFRKKAFLPLYLNISIAPGEPLAQNLRNYHDAGISGSRTHFNPGYIAGLHAYLSGDSQLGLDLMSEAARLGYFIMPHANHLAALYGELQFQKLLKNQADKQRQERQWFLEVVCEQHAYREAWQPESATCLDFANRVDPA